MIQAHELRIGNWVSFDLHFKQITDFEIMEYASRNSKPIPLTPEILESCGLTIDLNGIVYCYDFHLDYDGHYFFPLGKGKVYIYFLHQFQNLYFCLCGVEIEVKLPALSV